MLEARISLEGLSLSVGRALLPLGPRMTTAAVGDLFAELGGQFPPQLGVALGGALSTVTQRLGSVQGFVTSLEQEVASSGPTVSVLTGQLVGAISGAVTALSDLGSAVSGANVPGVSPSRLQEFGGGLGVRLLDFALMSRLEATTFDVTKLLSFLGVLRLEFVEGDATDSTRSEFVHRELVFGKLPRWLGNPLLALQETYGFGGPSFGDLTVPNEAVNGTALIRRIADYLVAYSLHPNLELNFGVPVVEAMLLRVAANPTSSPPRLDIRLQADFPDGATVESDFFPGWHGKLAFRGAWPFGLAIQYAPTGGLIGVAPDGNPLSVGLDLSATVHPTSADSFPIFGITGGTRLEVGEVELAVALGFKSGAGQPTADGTASFSASLNRGRAVVDLSAGDGFLRSLTSGGPIETDFQLSARYSLVDGLSLEGGADLAVRIPVHASFGPVRVDGVRLGIPLDAAGSAVPLDFGVSFGTTFGPFALSLDDVGLTTHFDFGAATKNVGFADFSAGFKPPTGVGLSLDGPGGITGGGFLSFDSVLGRYSGALELQVFGIGVKAFGLLETKFPDGRDGFSFVVLISAEFTPVQIGFGFTLNGVGGLLGLNRSLVAKALGDAVRKGSIENLLFPHDPVRDAPTILNDLETIFPGTPDHYVFGPMAKLGWGTPTLITAELGIIIELPGPRLAVIGTAQTALPTRQIGLVRLNLAIAGVLDFPKRLFSLDASLYDSVVGSFPVAGDAAFRMNFGDRPNFALSIGGFNPSFKAPSNFPNLRRASVDLGVNGNPSLTLSGYFALTSNTAQIGAAITLRASGAGIHLDGHVSFDALFVFSPFSFDADLDAGMSVSFHGVGIGIHFHGHLSGPSPWRVSGDVCVSILWWDACLGVEATFGKSKRVELPGIDPWDAQGVDPALAIIGLQTAIQDSRNWVGSPPPSAVSVVSLAENSNPNPPIDPLGSATLRQKVAPLNQKLTKFGAFKPVKHDKFARGVVKIGETVVEDHDISPVKDAFASDTFKAMKAAERLSAPAYDDMEAGFTLNPDVVHVGQITPKSIEFETVLLDGNREEVGPPPPQRFQLTERHLRAMLLRSAAGLSGTRRTGLFKYVVPNSPVKARLPAEEFVVADACAFTLNAGVTASPTSHIQASLALEDHLGDHPEDVGRFTVVPRYEIRV